MHIRDVILLQNNISQKLLLLRPGRQFPGSVFLKCVSNSNCCHRHSEVYISMSKSFHTYRKYIYQQSTKKMGVFFFDYGSLQDPCVLTLNCLFVSYLSNVHLPSKKVSSKPNIFSTLVIIKCCQSSESPLNAKKQVQICLSAREKERAHV